MAIAATSTTTGAPFAKFVDIDDVIIGTYAGSSRRQRRNFNTGQPMFKDDGKPMLEEILHLVAMPGTTAKTGDADRGYNDIEPGSHVRYSVSGFKWKQLIDGRKALPAHGGFVAGQECSGDVYTFRLVGWSATTTNAASAARAGFTVVDGRIVLRSQDDKDRYVVAQSRSGGNTNPAKDIEVSVRRPTADEKRWEQAADELFLTKPWEKAAEIIDSPPPLDDADFAPDDAPF